MGQGGDAVLYSGGVPIIGAEVEIGAGPSPLPLDIERDWLVTSFWTVRMHSDYTGPIARVKRSSDNAELDYSSLTELKAFVGGGAWSYLRFYNQANGQSALSPNLSGSFDANGIPRANLLPSSVAEINAQFDKFTTPQTTLVFAAQSEASDEVQAVNVTLFTDNPNERFLNLSNASSLSSVRIFGPPPSIITTISSTDARQVFGSVSSNTSVVIRRDNVTSTVAGDATLAVSKFVMSAEDFSSTSSTPCRLWGAAFWRKGLSPSDFQATLTKVKTRLQF
jgi:hypothetical protein